MMLKFFTSETVKERWKANQLLVSHRWNCPGWLWEEVKDFRVPEGFY